MHRSIVKRIWANRTTFKAYSYWTTWALSNIHQLPMSILSFFVNFSYFNAHIQKIGTLQTSSRFSSKHINLFVSYLRQLCSVLDLRLALVHQALITATSFLICLKWNYRIFLDLLPFFLVLYLYQLLSFLSRSVFFLIGLRCLSVTFFSLLHLCLHLSYPISHSFAHLIHGQVFLRLFWSIKPFWHTFFNLLLYFIEWFSLFFRLELLKYGSWWLVVGYFHFVPINYILKQKFGPNSTVTIKEF